MSEDFNMYLNLDTSNAEDKLRRLEQDKNRVDRLVNETKKRASFSFNQVLSMTQMMWGVMDAFFRTIGLNVSMQFRLLMRTGFAAARVLTPLLLAQSMTPLGKVQAGIGLLNLSLAISALQMLGQEQSQAQTQLAAATEMFAGINSMLGMMNFR